MSGDPEQEYFSDGIADDIITELSRIRWLFVIARNSSFTYKGHAIDVKQVGRELGVRYVLEGSVRRGGRGSVSTRSLSMQRPATTSGRSVTTATCLMSSLSRTRLRLRSPGPLDRLSLMPNSGGHCASRQQVLAPGRHTSGVCGICGREGLRMFRWPGPSSTVPSNSTRRSPPPIRDWRCCSIMKAPLCLSSAPGSIAPLRG